MPNLPEVERLILGAALEGHKAHKELIDQVELQDYFVPQHVIIAGAMKRLRAKEHPTDLLAVQTELDRAGEMAAAGGIAYLADLCRGIPACLKLEHHVRALKDRAALRAVIRTAHAIQERAFEASEDAGLILDGAIEDLSAIARESASDEDATVSYRDASAQLLGGLDKTEAVRIRTGLSDLDEKTGGFRAGELGIITGETGHGKTQFAQQTRHYACIDGYHSLYCSGEMLAPHLLARELAANAGVKPSKMRLTQWLTAEDWRALTHEAGEQCTRCQILDRELTLSRIRRVARRMKGRQGLDLLIVDYDELVTAPGKDEFEQQRTSSAD